MPDRDGREALDALQSALRSVWPGRDEGWLLGDDLHLTLRYLGDLYPDQLDAALASLRLAEDEPALTLRFRGIGLWPSQRPRLAVARLADDARVAAWVGALEHWAVREGLPAEHRAHAAHVTLLRSPRPLGTPDSAPPLPDLCLRFDRICAMHRHDPPRGPRYATHAAHALCKDAATGRL